MSKRTLVITAAALASLLLLIFGVQQAVLATTAAWSDRASFSAPVTSGTWATTPPVVNGKAPLTFNTVPRFDVGNFPTITYVTQIQNNSNGNGQAVSELTVKLALPERFSGTIASVTTKNGKVDNWASAGEPVLVGGQKIFEFRYIGPVLPASMSNTGELQVAFSLTCSKADIGKAFASTTTVSSPQAIEPIRGDASFTIPSWWDGCKK